MRYDINKRRHAANANDTPYGLAGFISERNEGHVHRVAAQLRAGNVTFKCAPLDFSAPFGGFKQSGNGREWGNRAFTEFPDTKLIYDFAGADNRTSIQFITNHRVYA